MKQPAPEELPEAFGIEDRIAFRLAVAVDPELIAWTKTRNGEWVNQFGVYADEILAGELEGS